MSKWVSFLTDSLLLTGSGLLLSASALWVLFQTFKPMFHGIQSFFRELVGESDVALDQKIKDHLISMGDNLTTTANDLTNKVIKKADVFYGFKTSNADGSGWIRFWSFEVFIVSWFVGLFYLCTMILAIGYEDLSEVLVWNFIALIVFYGAIIAKRRPLFDVLMNREASASVLLQTMVVAMAMAMVVVVVVVVAGALAVAGAGAGALAGAGAVAGAAAGAWTWTWTWAWAMVLVLVLVLVLFGIVSVVVLSTLGGAEAAAMFWTMLESGSGSGSESEVIMTNNVFRSFSLLEGMGFTQTKNLFFVFFLVMPLVNASLDSLSLSVTRHELQKLKQSEYGVGLFIRVSAIDFLWAIGFKLLVLFMLYLAALVFEETGATFAAEEIRVYWRTLLAIFGPEAGMADLWQGNTNKMITLMISTTLIPTLVHFGLVVVNVAYTTLGSVIKLFALLFTGNARFFATAMSAVLLLLIYGLIYFETFA